MAKKNTHVLPELPFKSDAFAEAWEEWLLYRRERRLPAYKPVGLKRTFNMLIRDSDNNEETAIAMLGQSIEQNYQGIFPLKPKKDDKLTKHNTGQHLAGKYFGPTGN
jgi:hypothetical protein